MKKRFLATILLLCIILGIIGYLIQKSEEPKLVSENTNTSNIVNTDNETNVLPTYLSFDRDNSTYLIQNKTDALTIVKDILEQYGLGNIDVNLEKCRESKTSDLTSYHFSQIYEDIPVYGREIIVCTDSTGQLQGISNNYISLNNINTSVHISEEEARKIVEKQYSEKVHICNDGKTIYSLYGEEPTLAWQFYVNGPAISESCFVDVSSGDILATFSDILIDIGLYEDENGTVLFNTKKTDNGTYLLIDEERNLYVYDSENQITKYAMMDEAGNVYYYNDANDKWYKDSSFDSKSEVICIYHEATEKWTITDMTGYVLGQNAKQIIYTNDVSEPLNVISNNSTIWNNEKAAKAISLVESTYDFFKIVLKRQGYDGSNGRTNIYINDGWDNGNNAYSHLGETRPPTVLALGSNQTLTADLIGHEFTHSVERTTSGMIYQHETGSLMEGLSDVFGELVEDWIIDNELDDDCDWIHGDRNMIHPSEGTLKYCYYARNGLKCPVYKKNGKHIPGKELIEPGWFSIGCCEIELPYPDIYQGENYWTGDDDYGGCHSNCTVISHACYLMTHSKYGTSLTNEELAKLLYNTLGSLLPDCNFNEFATAVYNNAIGMRLANEKVEAIEKAFKQVGLTLEDKLVVKLDKSQPNNIPSLESGHYEYTNGQFLSEFSIYEIDGKKNAELIFWHNYGSSSSDEDFFFEWECEKWEYTVLGNRANKNFLLNFTPTNEGVLIKVTCLEGTYYSWETGQKDVEWVNAEYKM